MTPTPERAIGIAGTQEATSHQLHDIRGIGSSEEHNLKPVSHQTCGNCGTIHGLSNKALCLAHSSKCKACGKANHWKRVCRSSKVNKPQSKKSGKGSYKGKPRQTLHSLEEQEMPTMPASPNVSQLYFDAVVINDIMEKGQTTLEVQVNTGEQATPLRCKVDTGAEGNVIPVDTYNRIFPSTPCDSVGTPFGLSPSTTAITAFGGQSIPHYGSCILNLTYNGHSNSYPFHVVNTGGPTVLGLPTCTDINLITFNYSITQTESTPATGTTPTPVTGMTSTSAGNPEAKKQLLQQCPDCFKGAGCFQGEFHITLDPNVPLVVHPPRRLPEALREPLREEFDSLVEQGIIAKVDEPTDWVNSLVFVTMSNGSLRLCLDPKDLNKAIKRPHY